VPKSWGGQVEYTIILEPQEEGGFTARCVELPGAISEGETMTEALQNIREAADLICEVLLDDMKCEKSDLRENDNNRLIERNLTVLCHNILTKT
jgi:predicted RNase H-like HicB family nuclease